MAKYVWGRASGAMLCLGQVVRVLPDLIGEARYFDMYRNRFAYTRNGPSMVSESTVSNTELSELF